MTNLDLSLHVFSFLRQAGAESVVVCAGARNAPLVLALQDQGFKIYSFFEERSAAFFAIGLIKDSRKPVAVMTTSGTAVAELLPAAVEATYQGLPLVLITADRPRTYRGSGAPQSIEQVGLFSHYVETVYDLDVQTENFEFTWSRRAPLQLNICLDEPLIDHASGAEVKTSLRSPEKSSVASPVPLYFRRPLIILGELDKANLKKVKEFILRSAAPVWAEAPSQLKADKELQPQFLKSSEQLVQQVFSGGYCDSVIRIGGVPTLRFWRDLEKNFIQVPVFNFSARPYSGLARESGLWDISQLPERFETEPAGLEVIKDLDLKRESAKLELLRRYPDSEQAMAQALSHAVGRTPLYLGNSLPVRHWDHFANCQSESIAVNRGANGIDGQVSTYLGWSENLKNSYCLLGDLTALYDLAALALTPQLNKQCRSLIIMNNQGGQIFNRVFKNNDFINSHQTEFGHWARMWNWNYFSIHRAAEIGEVCAASRGESIIELRPDAVQTAAFWADWDLLCQQ